MPSCEMLDGLLDAIETIERSRRSRGVLAGAVRASRRRDIKHVRMESRLAATIGGTCGVCGLRAAGSDHRASTGTRWRRLRARPDVRRALRRVGFVRPADTRSG